MRPNHCKILDDFLRQETLWSTGCRRLLDIWRIRPVERLLARCRQLFCDATWIRPAWNRMHFQIPSEQSVSANFACGNELRARFESTHHAKMWGKLQTSSSYACLDSSSFVNFQVCALNMFSKRIAPTTSTEMVGKNGIELRRHTEAVTKSDR